MTEAVGHLGAAEDVDRDSGEAGGASQTGDAGAPPTGDGGRGRRRRALVGGITAVLALPLAVAAWVQRSPGWHPSVDMIQIEMRVRDVGLSHPPLLGLGGRIFGLGAQGSHPGPISFYALAPAYRLFGADPWALQVAAAAVNVVAIGLAVWLGHRRWGAAGAVGTATAMALLLHGYGAELLTVPWNPQFPVLWWAVLVLAVWSVLDDDRPALLVAVLAATACAQTHIPYIGLVGGMAALVATWLAVRAVRDPGARRSIGRWAAGAGGLALLLWLPPIVEQVTGNPGNVSIIADNFRHADEPPIGLGAALDIWLERLAPGNLLLADRLSSTAAAVVLLVAWVAAAAIAVRLRHPRLLRLHAVTGAALVLGLVSISRILGNAWPYLTYWLLGTLVLALAAVAATATVAGAAVLAARRPGRTVPRWVAPISALVLVAVPVLAFTGDAAEAPGPDPDLSAAVRDLGPATVDAIEDGDVAGDGADGRYAVTWSDPVGLGSAGFALLAHLERQGIDARALDNAYYRLAVRPHRVTTAAAADAEIHVSVGAADIERWSTGPGVVEVARHDPRTAAERQHYRDLERDIVERLETEGLADLADLFLRVRMAAAIDERLPNDVSFAIAALSAIPEPVAVFVTETGGAPARGVGLT